MKIGLFGGETLKFTLKGEIEADILNYGGVIQSLRVPDRSGHLTDVVLGYDGIDGYKAGSCCMGAVVGRYANRIKGARFSLGGQEYVLEQNDGANHLHGTYGGRMFDAFPEGGSALTLRLDSPDMEDGFPGTLKLEVRYSVTGRDLIIDYTAVSDRDTVINITNHSYFNLSGRPGSDILGHRLRLDAEYFTECGPDTCPTGNILPVAGTPLDFREAKEVGRDIFSDFPQTAMCCGYDHNFILGGGTLKEFGSVFCPESGITMTCLTTQPGVQLYTGNFLDGDKAPWGKGGVRYPRYGGLCLETQHYPCSPNFPEFPSTVLRAGETYSQRTVYRFGAE